MKYLLSIFTILICLGNSNAQNNSFIPSISLGVNASQVNGDKLAGFDKFGINAGVGIQRKFGTKNSFAIEFNYSEKGSKDVASANNPVPDTLFKFNYIDIPLIYSREIYPKLKLNLGIYNSVLLKATFSDYVIDYDKSNVIRKTDHGVIVGLEYNFTDNFAVNARVSQSVFDLNTSLERYFNLVSSLSIKYSIIKN